MQDISNYHNKNKNFCLAVDSLNVAGHMEEQIAVIDGEEVADCVVEMVLVDGVGEASPLNGQPKRKAVIGPMPDFVDFPTGSPSMVAVPFQWLLCSDNETGALLVLPSDDNHYEMKKMAVEPDVMVVGVEQPYKFAARGSKKELNRNACA
jgi:hypothetical protein